MCFSYRTSSVRKRKKHAFEHTYPHTLEVNPVRKIDYDDSSGFLPHCVCTKYVYTVRSLKCQKRWRIKRKQQNTPLYTLRVFYSVFLSINKIYAYIQIFRTGISICWRCFFSIYVPSPSFERVQTLSVRLEWKRTNALKLNKYPCGASVHIISYRTSNVCVLFRHVNLAEMLKEESNQASGGGVSSKWLVA